MKFTRAHILSLVISFVIALAAAATLAACTPATSTNKADLSPYPVADMSGYESFTGYDQPSQFVEVTAYEALDLADSSKDVVIFCAFDGCPWCEVMAATLNDAALAAGWQIAYVNTRSDPSWKSNTDMDGYDEFVARFGEYMDEDESGNPHLYVPDLYFVRNGEVVAHHQGVLASYQEPGEPLTDDEATELREILDGYFAQMN